MNKIYPFKFLDSYSKDDTGLFFGRDEEINDLYQMIFESDMLMVYGASGTGKTSLIQCGLASKFQPHDWLALYIRRGSDLNQSFDKEIMEARGITGTADLAKSFKAIYRSSFRPLYLIFDQFEELFILGTKEEEAQFIKTIQGILNIEQPVKMIFSMREEYLGHLYEFEKAIPQIMRKKLRVEPMNLDKVRQVIIGVTTFEGSNISLKKGDEQAIIEAIFDKIKGSDKTLTIQLPYLQVFLDKLYMATTQDETRQAGAVFTLDTINKMGDIGDILRDFLEEQVKTISQKLSTDEKPITVDNIWDILSPFATLEGTKDPISMQTLLQRLPGVDAQLVAATVKAFVDGRILRHNEEGDIYELAHDSLAGKIAGKRTDEEVALLEVERLIKSQLDLKKEARGLLQENQLNVIDLYWVKLKPRLDDDAIALINNSREAIKEEKGRKRRLAMSVFAAALAVIIILSGLTFWAFTQKKAAKLKTMQAQSLALASQAFTEIYNGNVTLAFRYAQYAFEKDSTNLNAGIALYNTVFQPHDEPLKLFYSEIKELDTGSVNAGVIDKSVFNPMRVSIEKEKGTLIINDLIKGTSVNYGNGFADAVLSPDGTRLLTRSARMNGWGFLAIEAYPITLWDTKSGKKITEINGREETDYFEKPSICIFSPDSRYFLTSCMDKGAALWDAVTGKKTAILMQSDIINKASFSKDGRYIVTWSSGPVIRKWPLDEVLDCADLPNSIDVFHSSDRSGNSGAYHIRLLATPLTGYNPDEKLVTFDKKNGCTTVKLPGHKIFKITKSNIEISDSSGNKLLTGNVRNDDNQLYDLIVSPGEKYLFGRFGKWKRNEGGNQSHIVINYSVLWDIERYCELGTFNVSDGIFSPGNRFLFSTESNSFRRLLIDVKTGTPMVEIDVHTDTSISNRYSIYERSYSFSKDSKALVRMYKKCRPKDDTDYEHEVCDSFLQTYLIDPREIINKMKDNIGDLLPSDKANSNYGLTDKAINK
jgi:WD40 repeat protein